MATITHAGSGRGYIRRGIRGGETARNPQTIDEPVVLASRSARHCRQYE
jgi:hypothetical protein